MGDKSYTNRNTRGNENKFGQDLEEFVSSCIHSNTYECIYNFVFDSAGLRKKNL